MKELKSSLLEKVSSLGTAVKFVTDMIDSTDAETIFARRSVNAETIVPSLSTKDGKVVLVGYAAHAM